MVHARKAWLKGLSPKENRDVPPLDYALVYGLKAAPAGPDHRHQRRHRRAGRGRGAIWRHVDGVMLGRAAYHNPGLLLDVDRRSSAAERAVADGFEAVERLHALYGGASSRRGVRLHAMTRHMLGLFAGRPGARAWRRHLAVEALKPGAGLAVVEDALRLVDRHPAEAPRRDTPA